MRASRKKQADDVPRGTAGSAPPAAKAQVEGRRPAELSAPELPGGEYLANPVNAAPLADLIARLQQSYGNRYVQRLVEAADEAPPAPQPEDGQPLPAAARAPMEAAFGTDLGAVRLHTGGAAQHEAEALGARAFTRGSDIYFNQGEYDPASRAGQQLLAHELAHVVQQQDRPAAEAARSVDQAGDTFEQEAHAAAAAVLAGQHPQIASRGGIPALQRVKKDEQPVTMSHSAWIDAAPEQGTIDAGGRFAVGYHYAVPKQATVVTLTLTAPAGVTVAVAPLAGLGSGDYQVNDPGGTGARAVVISVSSRTPPAPLLQVTLTRGTFSYLVVFSFPLAAPSKPGPAAAGKPGQP